MIHVAVFESLLFKQLVLYAVICAISDKIAKCNATFIFESFQSCGIFLQDSQPSSIEQGDVVHEIIEHLQVQQTSLLSLTIKNEQSGREIHPVIFRSMKYDCFLYVHVNFGKNLFSTIPSLKNPILSALYQKGLFVILVNSNPHDMFTSATWNLQLERQYRIFVLRIKMTFSNTSVGSKQFVFLRTYFFCTFCMYGVHLLNPDIKNIFSLKLTKFESHWIPEFAEHYIFFYDEEELKNPEKCIKSDVIKLYNRRINCEHFPMLVRMIIFASGFNFTIKQRRDEDSSKVPNIFPAAVKTSFELHKYSSPILSNYDYPSIIYCFNLKRVTLAQTNMWTKYVAIDTWCIVGASLFLLSLLKTIERAHGTSLRSTMRNLFLFLHSFLKIIGIISRQSWSHKWKLFGLVEIMFSTLISVYENSITAEVVVPVVPQPFSNTRELYNNNYTFVVTEFPNTIFKWLSDEYSTVNHPRVLSITHFADIGTWLEKYFFLKPAEGKKFAIVGELSKNYHFRAVTLIKEKNHTCYQMYPKEEAFMAHPVFFSFKSTLASSLQKGVLLLQAFGFTRAFADALDFLGYSVALRKARSLAAKYDYKMITYKELKSDRLKESMITLANFRLILYLKLILNLSSCFCLILELISKKVVLQ